MTNTWSNEKIIDFISVIHAHPELWNVNTRKYKNRDAKKDGWAVVADKFGITSDEAYKKFRSLRTYAKSEEKKSGSVSGKSVKWFAFDAISFILTHDTSNTEDTGLGSEYAKANMTQNLDNENTFNQEVDSESTDCLPSSVPYRKSCASKKIKPSNPILGKAKNIKRQAGEKRQNEYDSFAEHIANKISKYDNYTRAQAEFKIMQVLYECDMKMYRYSAFSTNQLPTSYSPRGSSEES